MSRYITTIMSNIPCIVVVVHDMMANERNITFFFPLPCFVFACVCYLKGRDEGG